MHRVGEGEQLGSMKKTCQISLMLLLLVASCFAWPGVDGATVAGPSAGESVVILQSSPSATGIALLSCIGGGMALGGLISARWGKRGDK